MAKIAEMTQLSPTMAEGTIVKWLKKAGESIEPGEIIAEIETDKAVMEMEAYDNATLLAIVAEEGSKVKVGFPIAIIGKAGEDFTSLLAEAKTKLASSNIVTKAPTPVKVEAPKAVEGKEVKSSEPPSVIKPPENKTTTQVITKPIRKDGRLLASPLAKSIALDKGIDINFVFGTGPEGRITKSDVLNHISFGGKANNNSKISIKKEDVRIELSGMRKVIAERLVSSKQNVPHFYLNLEFDAEPIVNLRKKINEDLKKIADKEKKDAVSLSINDFIIKASAYCLQKFPSVNSSWRGDHILQLGNIDIGIAVSLEGGLITPYIRNADSLSISELHSEIKALATRARERKLKVEEYSGGSFTVSNLGMYGITSFSAIINEPEGTILAVGTIVEKPVIRNGAILPGSTITVTLSCDHRVVDGALGAQFLQEFKQVIENPTLLLI